MTEPACFLAQFRPDVPCDGRVVRVHLIPRQLLKRHGYSDAIADPRTYVYACGGPMGASGHHGMLDSSRTLRVPLEAVPQQTRWLAYELGLDWWIEREYGRGR